MTVHETSAPTRPAPQKPPDLGDYLRILRSRKLEIATVALFIFSSVMVFTFRQTPIYTSEASVLVKGVPSAGTPAGPIVEPNLETEKNLVLQSRDIARAVQARVGPSPFIGRDAGTLSVDVVLDTELLAIRYSHPDPRVASRVAQAYALAYVDFRTQQAVGEFTALATATQSRIDELQSRLAELRGQIQSASDPSVREGLEIESARLSVQLGGLEQRLLDLASGQSVAQDSALLVRPAGIPTSPSSPDRARNGLIGLAAGLVIGVTVALVRERLDDRLKSRVELERRLGAPVLAAVPKVTAGRKNADPGPLLLLPYDDSPITEAYRFLATNLSHVAAQEQLKIVMVTSARRGEGKTTTSCNLAMTIARRGRRVVLVSADLRRPHLDDLFGSGDEPGLSDLLSHSLPLTALTSVMTEPIPNLSLIAAGNVLTDPAGLFEIQRLEQFMNVLRNRKADIVIVDAPPVLGLADTSALAPLVDGTIFVLDPSQSGRSTLSQARAQLNRAGARILGIVYNNFDPSTASADQGFSYDYTEYTEEHPQDSARRASS
jgi:capsular exopolysaccharide synthesis family protein